MAMGGKLINTASDLTELKPCEPPSRASHANEEGTFIVKGCWHNGAVVAGCPTALETHKNAHVGTHLLVEDATGGNEDSLTLSTNKGGKNVYRTVAIFGGGYYWYY